jgi:hypothetical protein
MALMILRAIRNTLLRLVLVAFCLGWAEADETQRVYLSGHGKDDAVPWRFMCTTGALSGFWTNLPVPSNWDVKGFGHLTYKKDYSNSITERGLYEKDFAAPKKWKDQRVFLVFEGAMTDTSAKLNGLSVGPTHQGGFYRFKYEVTDKLKLGAENKLEVTVAKHSANESVNKAERLADYWVFGGIYRPVYLEVVPQQFIERVAIDARGDGSFAMEVFLNGVADADAVEAQIVTVDGKKVGDVVAAGILPAVEPGFQPGEKKAPDDSTVSDTSNASGSASPTPGGKMPPSTAGRMPAATITTRIASPKLWTAETPNLYRVKVRLKRGSQVLHEFTERFGFRTFEVRDGDGLYLNGQKIILKGVNRHSAWPDSGRCLSTAVHKLDIETIKEMNGNAVRMSHYPPDAEFLDLCDELGLYVLDELAGWHNNYDTPTGTRLVEAMVTRDVNHPSILFWDNGNEGGSNPELDQVFHEFDPQKRRVLHPWALHSGLNTAHYLMFTNAEVAARGEPMHYHAKYDKEFVNTNLAARGWIYMPTEFMHGLYDGGAGAGLEDYWSMMMSSSNCAGGFIWVFADEGIKNPHTGQIDVAGNQAPDGIVGPYREREASFYAVRDIWSPIQVKRQTNGSFTVENQYGFTDANQWEFTWETRQLWAGLGTNTIDRIFSKTTTTVDLPPGRKADLPFPFPANWDQDRANTLVLRVTDARAGKLWTWAWPARTNAISPNVASFGPPTVTETSEAIEIKTRMLGPGGWLRVKFSRQTGRLTEAWNDERKFSFAGPRLVSGTGTLKSIQRTHDGGEVTVVAAYDGDLQQLVWRVRNDGLVICDYRFLSSGATDAVGVVFDYPENLVKQKRWLGDGPFRVWKNRLRGVTFGLWENDYNNTITGYSGWQYPEFKGCFANVRWLQLETTEGLITVVPENIPYVQVLTPEQPPDNLIGKTKVNLPQCGLGFLHSIPPIGTKFKPAAASGPQSQPNVGQGEYSGRVSFYFGKLP